MSTAAPLESHEQLVWQGKRRVGTRVGPRLIALVGAIMLCAGVIGLIMLQTATGETEAGPFSIPLPLILLFFGAIGFANWTFYQQTGRWRGRRFRFWRGSPHRGEYVLTDRRALRRDQHGNWQTASLIQVTPVLGEGRYGDKCVTFLSGTGIEVLSFDDLAERDAHCVLELTSRLHPPQQSQQWLSPPPPSWPPHG